jgi:hypothetical protein
MQIISHANQMVPLLVDGRTSFNQGHRVVLSVVRHTADDFYITQECHTLICKQRTNGQNPSPLPHTKPWSNRNYLHKTLIYSTQFLHRQIMSIFIQQYQYITELPSSVQHDVIQCCDLLFQDVSDFKRRTAPKESVRTLVSLGIYFAPVRCLKIGFRTYLVIRVLGYLPRR